MRLDNWEKLPMEIARVLSNSELVQRLILIDSTDALSADFTEKTLKELLDEQYISLIPVKETGIENIERNIFIVILCGSGSLETGHDNDEFHGSIFLCTDLDHLVLDDYTLRLNHLTNTIITLIQDKKFSCSGQLKINNFSDVAYSDYLSGYRINFSITDLSQKGESL